MDIAFLFALAAAGLADSAYILWHKAFKKKLMCVIGEDCDEVVKSKYGKLFGVPNELFGLLYYLFIAGVSFLMMQGISRAAGVSVAELARFVSLAAFLASLYLIGIQIFRLRKWCEYCLFSACINLAILLLLLWP
ncbi:MAG: vitamin K epoxide reductase family protein [Candidatus Wildermuthbacteria bacterium]|nr:vitamin K epoxide reductase family protein [Candidatus Wildermuthbacteria bacterium]